MDRRNISKILLGSVAGTALLSERARAQGCVAPCYVQTAAEIAAGVSPTDTSYEAGDLRRYGGVGDGATNNNAAFTNANAAAAVAGGTSSIHIPAGDFKCTSLPTISPGVRLTGEGRITTTTTHRRTWEYGGEASTPSDRTYFVDSYTGNDANSGLSSGAAFKTLQRAWNQLPPLVLHRITIQVADGYYDTQELSPSDMPRPAILWLTGKYVRGRTDQSAGGNGTTGYVLWQGTSKGTVIRTASGYPYGVYASQVNNTGFDELTIRSNTSGTVALLVSHRTGTYLQGSNIDLDGNSGQSTIGCYVESGAVLELTGNGVISGSQVGVEVFDESYAAIADAIAISAVTSGFAMDGRGTLLLAGRVTVTTASTNYNGHLKIQGTDASNRVVISGGITGANGEINAVYCNFAGAILVDNMSVFLNACEYSNAIQLNGGNIALRSTSSFISPATVSTVATPLALVNGASFMKDSLSLINGSTGRTNATYNGPIQLPISSNGATVGVYLGGGQIAVQEINGNGGNRTNCVLAAVDSSYGGMPPENQVLMLINPTANSVQLVNSTSLILLAGLLHWRVPRLATRALLSCGTAVSGAKSAVL